MSQRPRGENLEDDQNSMINEELVQNVVMNAE